MEMQQTIEAKLSSSIQSTRKIQLKLSSDLFKSSQIKFFHLKNNLIIQTDSFKSAIKQQPYNQEQLEEMKTQKQLKLKENNDDDDDVEFESDKSTTNETINMQDSAKQSHISSSKSSSLSHSSNSEKNKNINKIITIQDCNFRGQCNQNENDFTPREIMKIKKKFMNINNSSYQSEFQKKYKVVGKLGKGQFGEVELVVQRQQLKELEINEENFLLEIIPPEIKEKLLFYAAKSIRFDNNENQLYNEWNLLKSLDNPFVIKVEELLIDKTLQIGTLVMEYFEGQSLYQLLKINPNHFTYESICIIMSQLLITLHYLHKYNIVHRDISLNNVLFNIQSKTIKLIDFNISKDNIQSLEQQKQQSEENSLLNFYSPTSNYLIIAPEIREFQPLSEKVDIYCAGLILLSLCFEKPIYAKKKYNRLFDQMDSKRFSQKAKFKQLAQQMLEKNPVLRPSAASAIFILGQLNQQCK